MSVFFYSSMEEAYEDMMNPPSGVESKIIKTEQINGSVSNATAVIVYGNIKGSISGCQNVVVINGDVRGSINNCENVAGLLSDKVIGEPKEQ